jgi:CheY-like chemotaxis protein
LAGGIAHDFNNLLVSILGNADLAYDDLPPNSPVRPLVAEILETSRQAAGLTNQMLAYSGKGHFVVAPLDVNALLGGMRSLLASSVSRKVHLEHELADDLPAIMGDDSQFRQIVMNLVINASEACGEEPGKVMVRTRRTDCDRAFFRQSPEDRELPEGHYVSFEVSDTGCGMDEETKARVFDPFFTTKPQGRGLGMAAVQGIIRGHKGAIRVESEPGVGTTFRVLFPALDQKVEASEAEATPADGWRCEGTVLVVDDVDGVRSFVSSVLERLGLTALTASDGVEATALFKERHAEIDCVLLDLKMPNMGGEETFAELRKVSPDVPVILSSGYSEKESIRQFAGKGLAGFIQKPYRLAKLRETLREVLEG